MTNLVNNNALISLGPIVSLDANSRHKPLLRDDILLITETVNLSLIDILKLGFLAAIWGASFIFMRMAVPEVGTFLAAALRIIIAGGALYLFAKLNHVALQWRRNLLVYTLAGLFGAALPFSLFSYASQYFPAACSALFNATGPLFGALFSVIWLAERLTWRKFMGLILGVAGVTCIVGTSCLWQNRFTLLAFLACLAGPACFAISAIVIKYNTCSSGKRSAANKIEPLAMAAGAMVMAGVIMLPLLPFSLPEHMPSVFSISLIVALALFSSAAAQIIFIPLIVKIGPTRAMSVSFLIPLFSILWGYLFLQESISGLAIVGGLIVLSATALVLKD